MFPVEPPKGATIQPEFNAMECATLRHLIEIGMQKGDELLVHGIRAVGEKLAVATLQAMPPAAREEIPRMIEDMRKEIHENEDLPEDVREGMAREVGDLVARLEAAADKDSDKLDEAEVEAFDADALLDQINAEASGEESDDSHD